MCELTQRGMASRGFTPGRYTEQEIDVHEFDVMVADRYLEALAGAGGRVMSAATATATARRRFDAIVVGGGPQRPDRRRLPRPRRPARLRPRARATSSAAPASPRRCGRAGASRARRTSSRCCSPKVVDDLELTTFGYDPIPLDPEFATFAADGSPILLPNDEQVTYEQVARVSRKDADALAAVQRAVRARPRASCAR